MILALLLACTDPTTCTDLGETPGGLTVTIDEHPGWGRAQCITCHPAVSYHQLDCMSSADLDLEALQAIDPADPAACVSCHGGNGVEWLEALEQDSDTAEDSGS